LIFSSEVQARCGRAQATQDAQDALAHLNDVGKAITIVYSAVGLVGSILAGDLGSIGDKVQGLFQAINR
jgi:hypothetical protein